jgi:hypothetical protein
MLYAIKRNIEHGDRLRSAKPRRIDGKTITLHIGCAGESFWGKFSEY